MPRKRARAQDPAGGGGSRAESSQRSAPVALSALRLAVGQQRALELIAAGATQVALGTVLFGDPDAPARVRAELEREAANAGFDHPLDAHGIAHESLPKQTTVDSLANKNPWK